MKKAPLTKSRAKPQAPTGRTGFSPPQPSAHRGVRVLPRRSGASLCLSQCCRAVSRAQTQGRCGWYPVTDTTRKDFTIRKGGKGTRQLGQLVSLQMLCWRHPTTAVAHRILAFGICVSANCFHLELRFCLFDTGGACTAPTSDSRASHLLDSTVGVVDAYRTPSKPTAPTGSSILVVAQAKTRCSLLPHASLGKTTASSLTQNPTLHESEPLCWSKPPSSHTEIFKIAS